MTDANSTTLLDSAAVRSLFGNVSDMWLWRRMKEGFLPHPLIINKRRFWRKDEIDAIIANLTAARDADNKAA